MSSVSGLSSSLNTSYADTYDASASSLSSKISSTDFSSASDDELMSVCKEFESYFVEQVLKSMEKMASIDGSDESSSLFNSLAMVGSDSDSGTSTLSSYYGDQMISNLASAITDSQGGSGLGIAQMLYEQMKRNYDTTTIATADTTATKTATEA